MFNPLVSVIVPNYNHARYLEQRLDTVFNQTYQNFEVIILDDKSTDNSLEVINRYKDNPHLSQIVVNEQNSGSPFKQWDKGINLAKGELIWIAESDDYNELNFLEELITEWQKHKNVVVAFSNYVMFADDNSWCSIPKERKNRCFNGKTFIRKRQVRFNAPVNASGVIFLKYAYDRMSHEYMNFRSAGDYMFWTAIMTQGDVVRVRKNLTYYRLHVGSVTSNNVSKGITSLEDLVVYQFIAEKVGLSWYDRYMASIAHYNKYMPISFDDENVRRKVLTEWGLYGKKKNKFFSGIIEWLPIRLENNMGVLL